MSDARAEADELFENTFQRMEREIGRKIKTHTPNGTRMQFGYQQIERRLDTRLQLEVKLWLDGDGEPYRYQRNVYESFAYEGLYE